MLKRLKNEKGFTFIEAILTMSLLAVSLGGTLAVFQNATTHGDNSQMQVIAVQLASEKLESIIADKVFKGYGTITALAYPSETLSVQDSYSNVMRTVTVTEVSPVDFATAQQGSQRKRVDVTITWGSNNLQSVTISTLVTSYSS